MLEPAPSRDRLLTWSAIAIAVFGIIARGYGIDRLPGINGDEAWYGANLQAMFSGKQVFWATPSGNPINPLHSGPLALLLSVFPPTLGLLRLPEVFWSILAVAIAFPLLRNPLGRRAALISTMWLAASPVAIAYGRLGWDPSGTLFITLIALAAAWRDRPIAALVSSVIAIAVHPTNVFFLPIVVGVWMPHGMRRYAAMNATQRRWSGVASAVIVLVGAAGMLLVLRGVANNPNTALPSIAVASSRVLSPSAWLQFLAGVGRLYSGLTTMTYVAGPPGGISWPLGVFISATAVLALAIGRRALSLSHHACLVAGMAISIVLFMIAAGPGALEPGFERYALFLFVPMIVAAALGLETVAGQKAPAAAVAIGLSMMVLTINGYFNPLMARGGDAHAAFRTGAIEPKRAVADYIASLHQTGTVVICDDWWSYWPLRYLLSGNADVTVSLSADANLPPGVRDRLPAAASVRTGLAVYEVAFENGDGWTALSSRKPVFTARDPIGRPILHVFRND